MKKGSSLALEPAMKSRSREDVAHWWRDHFVTSFVNETNPFNWSDREHDVGAFAMTQLCLTFCNAAAGLLTGNARASARDTEAFIRDHLGTVADPLGARYHRSAMALVYLFRHGLVHQREPGQIDLELDGASLAWVLGREGRREVHLQVAGPVPPRTVLRWSVFDPPFQLPNRGTIGPKYFLSVQPDVLYEDLLAAFQSIASRILEKPASHLAQRIHAGWRVMAEPRKISDESSRPEVLRDLQSVIIGADAPA